MTEVLEFLRSVNIGHDAWVALVFLGASLFFVFKVWRTKSLNGNSEVAVEALRSLQALIAAQSDLMEAQSQTLIRMANRVDSMDTKVTHIESMLTGVPKTTTIGV